MTDAKSRYEIIEGLTSQKTDLMDEITRLDDKVLQRENDIEQTKRNHARELERLEREHVESIEDKEAGLKSFEKSVGERKKILEGKIKEYERAISAIEGISASQAE